MTASAGDGPWRPDVADRPEPGDRPGPGKSGKPARKGGAKPGGKPRGKPAGRSGRAGPSDRTHRPADRPDPIIPDGPTRGTPGGWISPERGPGRPHGAAQHGAKRGRPPADRRPRRSGTPRRWSRPAASRALGRFGSTERAAERRPAEPGGARIRATCATTRPRRRSSFHTAPGRPGPRSRAVASTRRAAARSRSVASTEPWRSAT